MNGEEDEDKDDDGDGDDDSYIYHFHCCSALHLLVHCYHITVYISIYTSIYLYLYVCLSIYLSIYLSLSTFEEKTKCVQCLECFPITEVLHDWIHY